jgi:formylmethanofuran--tetrahydromethanopterin N-formyltransferase
MEIRGTKILETYAEAFPVWMSRVIVTAETREWAHRAAISAAGFATSRIGCPCEAGIESVYRAEETPDGRPGISILICGEKKSMKSNISARISQCILPVPTASAFDGFPDASDRIHTRMHYFGDGYESKSRVGERKCWTIPVMEGEYTGEERYGLLRGVAGGNFLVMGKDRRSALDAAEVGASVIEGTRGAVMSFPGGIVRSGSKVGTSHYRFPMPASTNHPLCPALKGVLPDSLVPDGVSSIYEIVINGIDEATVRACMRDGIEAAARTGKAVCIGASNFSGRLGPIQIPLHGLFG